MLLFLLSSIEQGLDLHMLLKYCILTKDVKVRKAQVRVLELTWMIYYFKSQPPV